VALSMYSKCRIPRRAEPIQSHRVFEEWVLGASNSLRYFDAQSSSIPCHPSAWNLGSVLS
jgi:hypothetical protein